VVIDDRTWESETGKSLQKVLNDYYYGLPQYEPALKAIQINRVGFNNDFQLYRNIIDVNISDKFKETKIWFGEDVYAKTQAYLKIEAKNSIDFVKVVEANAKKIRKHFRDKEIARLQKSYKNHFSQDIMTHLKKEYGVKIDIPANYKLDKFEDKFSWISFETPQMSQSILIYSYPYTAESQFEKDNLIATRDSILKIYVEGPSKGSYMQTETEYPVVREVNTNENDMYGASLRGLWRVENDFMGGPFVSYSFVDKTRENIVCVEGYVYNPKKDKRNFIMQLEAIIKTARYKQ
jgi:5'(3')-deoxyribonucleotidase